MSAASSERSSQPLVIWRVIDGKPGHENQTLGLVHAIKQYRKVDVYDVPVLTTWQAIKNTLTASLPLLGRPPPELVIGAGHRTHLTVLAVQRSVGGHSVVLMKPSLPMWLFDYCIVPEHDNIKSSKHILATKGVLNRIKYSTQHLPDQGLILVGGPSAHYDWNDDALIDKIIKIIKQDGNEWVVATSRRTPDSFIKRLQDFNLERFKLVLASDTSADWLPEQMQLAGKIWITEDSVSMVYEALSSGAQCGLIPVPRKHVNRVSRGIDDLLQSKLITGYEIWLKTGELQTQSSVLNESDRAAQWLLDSMDA